MTAPLQDALARLDALSAEWKARTESIVIGGGNANVLRIAAISGECSALVQCYAELRGAVTMIRLAHNLPASAASSAVPPADAPPCSAGLTAGASKDAPAISGGEG